MDELPYEQPLPADHGWSARPGFKVVVANRGEARFDVPREWVVEPNDGSDLCLYDRPPPDDNCRLEFSLMYAPPAIGADLALRDLLDRSTSDHDSDVLSRSAPATERREGLELVWSETRYRDADTKALALARTCLARKSGVHVVFTMSLWADDAARFDPAWREVLRSLELARPVDLSGRDPRRN
ncbi:MAG: hypothetical protein ACRDZO_15865 [Egibacteraceae bacterium]